MRFFLVVDIHADGSEHVVEGCRVDTKLDALSLRIGYYGRSISPRRKYYLINRHLDILAEL